ncbi:MAG: hypothetical protein JO001_16645 [Alphaproteobacteria bacterium]|nr:hypothetical protein [Alphaproteobacteria bacterium]
MTGGQGVALGCGILLLLPGACFILASGTDGIGIGVAILTVAGVLFWAAFSRPAKSGDEA